MEKESSVLNIQSPQTQDNAKLEQKKDPEGPREQIGQPVKQDSAETKDQPLRRSSRQCRQPTRFTFDKQHGYKAIKAYLHRLYYGTGVQEGHSFQMQYILALLIDLDYG